MSNHNWIEVGKLKAAADRCDGYLQQYSLDVKWEFHVLGLKLTAQWGADKFERFVDWNEFANANFDILEKTEKAALAGLSS